MEELIPLTDFDLRPFPTISEEEKVDFIINTNKHERINLTEDQVHSSIMIYQNALPAVSGQLRCINSITELAQNPNLIPKPDKITKTTLTKFFPWLFNLHGNLLLDFAQEGEKKLNDIDYPLKSDLGQYRKEERSLGHRKMPPPDQIKQLLVEAFQSYAYVYHQYHEKISTPRIMELSDWKKLEEAAYKLNLRLCCIKPFKEGSNRVARLTENLLRLNCGLKFKVIEDTDKLLRDIWYLQDAEYKIS